MKRVEAVDDFTYQGLRLAIVKCRDIGVWDLVDFRIKLKDIVSIGPLVACLGRACINVRPGCMVFFEVMASC